MHKILFSLSVLVLFSSCRSGGVRIGPKGDHPGRDDTAGDDTAGGDTSSPDDTGENLPPVELGGLQWRLHEEMGSLVYVSWDQSRAAPAHVEYSFDEGVWLSSPTLEAPEGRSERLIVGVPFETEAQWRVVVESGEEADGETILTADVPSGLPVGKLRTYDAERCLPSGWLLTSINEDQGGWTGGNYWTFIIDRQGRPVWAHLTPNNHWTLFAQVSVFGDTILWDEATYWSDWDSGEGSQVHRTWLDAEAEVFDTPGLHHAFVQLPDGTLTWGSQADGGGEALVEMAPGGEGEVLWTCDDDWPGSGRCESNGLFYSVERDSYLYSFYTNNSLLEIDRSTGESLWWAGEVRDGFSFDPEDSQFSWQHGVSFTDAGTLLLSTYAWDGKSTTMVREYEVDTDAGVLHEIWNFDPGVQAETNGDAWRLENGNTLHLVGSASHIYEVTPDGEPVWHVDYQGTRLLGRGQLISDLYSLVKPTE